MVVSSSRTTDNGKIHAAAIPCFFLGMAALLDTDPFPLALSILCQFLGCYSEQGPSVGDSIK